jgi:hypothetical protein
MRRTIACQQDIVHKSVLTAFIVKIEEKRINTTLDLLIRKAKLDIGNEMLEMSGIWENVIKNENTAERIRLMRELTQTTTTTRHRGLMRNTKRRTESATSIGHEEK